MKKKIHILYLGLITLNFQLITHNSLSQNVGINADGSNGDTNTMLDIKSTDNTSSTFGLKVKDASGDSKMVVRSDGNVGIGTDTPVEKLDLNGDMAISGSYIYKKPAANNEAIVLIGDSTASTAGSNVSVWGRNHSGWPGNVHLVSNGTVNGAVRFFDWNGTTWDQNMTVLPDGNVGIGTTTPQTLLDVDGTIKTIGDVNWHGRRNTVVNGNTIGTYLSTAAAFTHSGSTISATKDYTGGFAGAALGIFNQVDGVWETEFRFLKKEAGATTTDGAVITQAIIDNEGNLGIGTATPTSKLHVIRGNANEHVATINSTSDLLINYSNLYLSTSHNVNSDRYYIKAHTNGASNIDVFWVKHNGDGFFNGDVGIGTSSPAEKLEVQSGNIQVGTPNTGNGVADLTLIQSYDKISSPSAWRYGGSIELRAGDVTESGTSNGTGGDIILRAGERNVTGPNGRAGNIQLLDGNVGIGTTTPSYPLEVCGTIGTTAMSVTTGITCSSDIRYKKNITSLKGALEKVKNLKGVSYDWKKEEFPEKHFNDVEQIGVIAQDIEKVYPQLVHTDKDGFKSVDYAKFTPILIEAIKEQQEIIEHQKNEITGLKADNSSQKQKITSQESEIKIINNRLELIEEHLKTVNK